MPLLGPTTKMQPLFDNFMEQPYEVKRDCILCWATAMFTFTATPTLDIGLYKGIALALLFKCYEKAGNVHGPYTRVPPDGSPPRLHKCIPSVSRDADHRQLSFTSSVLYA